MDRNDDAVLAPAPGIGVRLVRACGSKLAEFSVRRDGGGVRLVRACGSKLLVMLVLMAQLGSGS